MTEINADFYKSLATDLASLLTSLQGLKPSEVQEITVYLNAGEYGLALGSICIGLRSNGIAVNRETHRRIAELLEKMGMESEYCAGISLR